MLWFYKGEDGAVHGPHSSPDMLRWFREGYFDLKLLLRRETDKDYVPLQYMMQQLGHVPFLPRAAMFVSPSVSSATNEEMVLPPARSPFVLVPAPINNSSVAPSLIASGIFSPRPHHNLVFSGLTTPELADVNSTPSPSPPHYPPAPGSDGCVSEMATELCSPNHTNNQHIKYYNKADCSSSSCSRVDKQLDTTDLCSQTDSSCQTCAKALIHTHTMTDPVKLTAREVCGLIGPLLDRLGIEVVND